MPAADIVMLNRHEADVSNDEIDRATAWLKAWDAQGFHRTATEGDAAGASWLANEVARLGARPAIEEFALDRLDPIAAFLEIDGARIDGVPMFDAPATGAAGIPAASGRRDPRRQSGLSSCRRMRSMRRTTRNCAATPGTMPWRSCAAEYGRGSGC